MEIFYILLLVFKLVLYKGGAILTQAPYAVPPEVWQSSLSPKKNIRYIDYIQKQPEEVTPPSAWKTSFGFHLQSCPKVIETTVKNGVVPVATIN